MDMNLSLRDKKILLMFFGVLFFFLGFYFGYKPMMETANLIAEENRSLETRLEDLMALAENKDFYVEEIEDMQVKIEEYCSQFPSEIRQEDGIVLAQNIENTLDVEIPSMSFGEAQVVIAMDGSTGPEEVYDDPTLSEQANAQTQAQINEIEGVQEEEAYGEDEVYSGLSGVPVLYRNMDSFQFTCTYDSLKDTILYLAEQAGRMTIDTISTSFDSSTGNLTGSMTVNLFSMTGTDGVYNTPDAGDVNYGTDNIFGTIENGGRRLTEDGAEAQDTDNTEDEDAAAADTEAADTQAADAAAADTQTAETAESADAQNSADAQQAAQGSADRQTADGQNNVTEAENGAGG